MPFVLTTQQIADLVGAPARNVADNWPIVQGALESLQISSSAAMIAAVATIRVECPPFKPIREYGTRERLNSMYDSRIDLGNTPDADGDGALYCGRGFIQITGRTNYQHYGELLGVDLVGNPEAALETNTAAAIFAIYFRDRKVNEAAEARDWRRVRRLVNGGLNGYGEFLTYVARLRIAIGDLPDAVGAVGTT